MGIHTAADFVDKLPADWIRKNMTVTGERMLNELKGIPSVQWEEMMKPKKGICTARSFGRLLSDKKDIREALANYAASCATKLREQQSCGGTLHIFIQTNIHRTLDKQYSRSITLQLPVPTNSSIEIIKHAFKGLDIIFKPGYNYKKTGVMVTDIVPDKAVQFSFFDTVNRQRDARIMKTVDLMNNRFGKDTVKLAAQGYSKNGNSDREIVSCYTTNITQVLTIKI